MRSLYDQGYDKVISLSSPPPLSVSVCLSLTHTLSRSLPHFLFRSLSLALSFARSLSLILETDFDGH